MKVKTRQDVRKRIRNRIRKRIAGTTERPRLAVFRSQSHIYAQVVDDNAGQTLCASDFVRCGCPGSALKSRRRTQAAWAASASTSSV
jgi:large subunit ribosomal protein L18